MHSTRNWSTKPQSGNPKNVFVQSQHYFSAVKSQYYYICLPWQGQPKRCKGLVPPNRLVQTNNKVTEPVYYTVHSPSLLYDDDCFQTLNNLVCMLLLLSQSVICEEALEKVKRWYENTHCYFFHAFHRLSRHPMTFNLVSL